MGGSSTSTDVDAVGRATVGIVLLAWATLGTHFRVVLRSNVGHDVIFAVGSGWLGRIFLARIAEEEAHVSNRVVTFCRLHAPNGISKAVLIDAFIKAFPDHFLAWDADDLLDTASGIHDGQSTREAVEKESGARLVRLVFRSKSKLAGQMRQHVITWILGGAREQFADEWGVDSALYVVSESRSYYSMAGDSLWLFMPWR